MKKTVILSALAFAGIQASAQVSDISVTLQPTASYNWFDNNTSIKDGLMVGGRLGFGLGEAFELRGSYERSVDLNSVASKIDILKDDAFESRDVTVERIGGELKANLPTGGKLAPYITLGSGIQKLKVNKFDGTDDLKSDQVYASGGLGVKLNLGNRLTFNLEGKSTIYNLNPTNVLYTPNANNDSKVKEWLNDESNTRMYNWSVLAGLQFYLGGREPDSMTALDRAYYRKFSGGLSGFKLIVEPGMAYIDFDADTNLRDTYLLGGQAGFDLNQYIGLRGYYYQSSENEKLSTDWDKLSIYGGDIIAKLNVSRGLVPYLTIGAGYMNVYDSYEGKTAGVADESGYFAKGGLGLTIPVSENLELFGAANLMYTSSRDAENLIDINTPDELKKHTMYNAGLRFQFGKGSNEEQELDELLASERKEADNLEKELKKAYESNDYDKAVKIIEKKKELDSSSKKDDKIRMTPQELESLVEKVIKGVDDEYAKSNDEKRIERLETLLLQNNDSEVAPVEKEETSQKILNELKSLNEKVDDNTKAINKMRGIEGEDKTVVVTAGADSSDTSVAVITTDGDDVKVSKSQDDLLEHKGVSAFAGVGFGDGTAAVAGLRSHYSFKNSNFEFTPDAYVSFGSKTGFGVNANVTYGFDKLTKGAIVKPYLGFGLGYNKVADEKKFGTNIIVGTSFDVLGGNLYADYTARGFVDIHQVAVGYKFNF